MDFKIQQLFDVTAALFEYAAVLAVAHHEKKKTGQMSSVDELKALRDALTKAENSYIAWHRADIALAKENRASDSVIASLDRCFNAFHIANVKQAKHDVSVELFNMSNSK